MKILCLFTTSNKIKNDNNNTIDRKTNHLRYDKWSQGSSLWIIALRPMKGFLFHLYFIGKYVIESKSNLFNSIEGKSNEMNEADVVVLGGRKNRLNHTLCCAIYLSIGNRNRIKIECKQTGWLWHRYSKNIFYDFTRKFTYAKKIKRKKKRLHDNVRRA